MSDLRNAPLVQTAFRVQFSKQALKAVAAVLNFVSKVGKELIIQIDRNCLTFRTLNDAKSAFALITFENNDNDFFDEFRVVMAEEVIQTSLQSIQNLSQPHRKIIVYQNNN